MKLALNHLKVSTISLAVMFALAGCSGDDGKNGTQGTQGSQGEQGETGQQGDAGINANRLIRLATVPTGAEVTGAFLRFFRVWRVNWVFKFGIRQFLIRYLLINKFF